MGSQIVDIFWNRHKCGYTLFILGESIRVNSVISPLKKKRSSKTKVEGSWPQPNSIHFGLIILDES